MYQRVRPLSAVRGKKECPDTRLEQRAEIHRGLIQDRQHFGPGKGFQRFHFITVLRLHGGLNILRIERQRMSACDPLQQRINQRHCANVQGGLACLNHHPGNIQTPMPGPGHGLHQPGLGK